MRSIDYNICYKINKIHDQNSILLVSDEYRDENLLIITPIPAKVSDLFFHLRVALLFCFDPFTEASVESFLGGDSFLQLESSDDFCVCGHTYLLYYFTRKKMLHEHEKDT